MYDNFVSISIQKGDGEDSSAKGEDFVYRETWGEQLVERHSTVICCLDIAAKSVQVLSQIPDTISPGQVGYL